MARSKSADIRENVLKDDGGNYLKTATDQIDVYAADPTWWTTINPIKKDYQIYLTALLKGLPLTFINISLERALIIIAVALIDNPYLAFIGDGRGISRKKTALNYAWTGKDLAKVVYEAN
jgi:hypothetical protein